jgi:hypothetical protein
MKTCTKHNSVDAIFLNLLQVGLSETFPRGRRLEGESTENPVSKELGPKS